MNTAGREIEKGQAMWMTWEMLQLDLRNYSAALELTRILNSKKKISIQWYLNSHVKRIQHILRLLPKILTLGVLEWIMGEYTSSVCKRLND